GAAIGALERRAFVARRLVKNLLVGRQIVEGVGRAQFVLGKWKIVEPGLAAIWTPPLGEDQRPVEHLGDPEVFLRLVSTRTATTVTVIGGVLGAAAFLDRHQGEMEIAIR